MLMMPTSPSKHFFRKPNSLHWCQCTYKGLWTAPEDHDPFPYIRFNMVPYSINHHIMHHGRQQAFFHWRDQADAVTGVLSQSNTRKIKFVDSSWLFVLFQLCFHAWRPFLQLVLIIIIIVFHRWPRWIPRRSIFLVLDVPIDNFSLAVRYLFDWK